MSPREIPRSSGLEWAGGEAELNLDVLEAQGGLPTDERALARIDHDDAEGPLLLTSLSGRFAPIAGRSLARALLGHPLFTFGVIARIHWHALRLWLRRVPFHRKPEPPRPIVTRGTP